MKKAGKKSLRVKHPFLKGIPEKYLKSILSRAKKTELEAGDHLFRDGQKAEACYLILKGAIEILTETQDLRIDIDPTETVLQELGAGEIVGWSWIIPPYRWRFDVRAKKDSELLVIDGVFLRKQCAKDHSLGYEIYKRLAPVMNQRMVAARLQLALFGGKPFVTCEGG